MKGKKVTYLFGAGASANALPVLNGMNDRLDLFVYFLKIATKTLNFNESPKFRINDSTFNKIDTLLNEIKSHYTIDTYAKKLYLLDEYKLDELKNFLSAYLVFEQLNKDNELCNRTINDFIVHINEINSELTEKFLFYKKSLYSELDYRYDSLYANLLNYQTKHISPDINFISWNYDNQFEIAYSHYCKPIKDIDEIQRELQIFPSLNNDDFDYARSAIIKLNGSCGFYDDSKKYSNLFNYSNHSFDETSLETFLNILIPERCNFKHTIKFAWENDEQVTKARKIAKDIIKNSDIIVVIGYSFPTFNREIDRFIFSEFDNGENLFYNKKGNRIPSKKVYIQDTSEKAPIIRERLKSLGNYIFEAAKIYDETDQFLIPNEL